MMVGDERPEAPRLHWLEKALLLREVKLLRYVDTEYLQSLAEIAAASSSPTAPPLRAGPRHRRPPQRHRAGLPRAHARASRRPTAPSLFRDELPSPDAADADGANPEVLRHRAGDRPATRR